MHVNYRGRSLRHSLSGLSPCILPRPEARLVSLGTGRAGCLGTKRGGRCGPAAARGVHFEHPVQLVALAAARRVDALGGGVELARRDALRHLDRERRLAGARDRRHAGAERGDADDDDARERRQPRHDVEVGRLRRVVGEVGGGDVGELPREVREDAVRRRADQQVARLDAVEVDRRRLRRLLRLRRVGRHEAADLLEQLLVRHPPLLLLRHRRALRRRRRRLDEGVLRRRALVAAREPHLQLVARRRQRLVDVVVDAERRGGAR